MRLIARIRCWFTGGHDEQRTIDPIHRTIKLACVDCGRESAGWTCDYDEPRVTQHGDQMRHVLMNPRLVQQAKKRGAPTWLHSVHFGQRGA